jgi:hypothetical protein
MNARVGGYAHRRRALGERRQRAARLSQLAVFDKSLHIAYLSAYA